MSRSKWKGYFCQLSLLKKKNDNQKKIFIWSRSSSIPHNLLNKVVWVHNGKIFKKIKITREKIGYKFGEFVFTRTKSFVKKKLKKNYGTKSQHNNTKKRK